MSENRNNKVVKEKISKNFLRKFIINYEKDISFVISFISLISSIVLAIYSIEISNHINDFTINMSPLNFTFQVKSPDYYTFNELVRDGYFGDENVKEIGKDGDVPLTVSTYDIIAQKDKFSGDYTRIMFATKAEKYFDICSFEPGEQFGYIFDDTSIILLTDNSDKKISFLYAGGFEKLSEKEYNIFNIILQGYNGEFYIYSILYSTSNYNSILIDSSNLYTIAVYEMFIEKNNLSIGKYDLLETVKDERTQLLSCLNS